MSTPETSPVITADAATKAVVAPKPLTPEQVAKQALINVATKEAMRKSVKALATSGLEGKELGATAGKLSSIAYNAPSLTQKALKELFSQVGKDGIDAVKTGLAAAKKADPKLSDRALARKVAELAAGVVKNTPTI